MQMMTTENKKNSFSLNPVWLGCFLMSTFALSRVFESSRALFQGLNPAQQYWLELGLWGMVLMVSMMVLAYLAYTKEKANGTLRHPIALFDWVSQKLLNQKENQ